MKQVKLSDLEIEILRKLVNGEAVSISSPQRIRLELAGMIREGAWGIVVTVTGRGLARQKPVSTTVADNLRDTNVARDRRGRRMPSRRRSIF
jgi:hypothetical protein